MRLLFVIMLLGSQTCFAQNKYREIAITTATGISRVVRFQSIEEENTFTAKQYFTIGIGYSETLHKNLFWETEIHFSKYGIKQKALGDGSINNYNLHVLTIPLQLRYCIYKYFFIKGGLLADMDLGSDKYGQSGFGAVVGVGVKIRNKKIVYTVYPYLQQHCLFSFRNEKNPLRLQNAGLKFNIGYQF